MFNQKERVPLKCIAGSKHSININLQDKNQRSQIVKFKKWLKFFKKLLVLNGTKYFLEKKNHFYGKFDSLTTLYTHGLLYISKERKNFEIAIFFF